MTQGLIPKGRFDAGGLPSLLRDVVRRLAVGRLDILGGGETRHIWFETGQARAVASEAEDEKLGKWLVKRGVLDASRMAIALLRQPDGVRFGAFLVQEGLLGPEALTKELEALSVGIVSHMLMEPGEWKYFDGEKLPVDAASLDMTTASLLAAAVREVPDEAHLRKLVGGDGFVWTAQDAILLYQQLRLTPQEGYLLSRVDGTSTVTQLQRLAPMPPDEYVRALAALSVTGLLEIRPTSAVKPLARAEVESPAEAEPEAEEALQYSAQEQREYAEVIKLAAEIRHHDYYKRLGLSPGATQDQLHSRYLEFVKLYHPDRAREKHLTSLRNELAEIYSALQEAYETLGHSERRTRYEKTLATSHNVDTFQAEERRRSARGEVVDANVNRARELLRAGDVGMAVQLLDQAARLNPTAETLLLLARAEFKNPMWSQRALDHLKHAVALAPEFTEAWLELANFWATRNQEATASGSASSGSSISSPATRTSGPRCPASSGPRSCAGAPDGETSGCPGCWTATTWRTAGRARRSAAPRWRSPGANGSGSWSSSTALRPPAPAIRRCSARWRFATWGTRTAPSWRSCARVGAGGGWRPTTASWRASARDAGAEAVSAAAFWRKAAAALAETPGGTGAGPGVADEVALFPGPGPQAAGCAQTRAACPAAPGPRIGDTIVDGTGGGRRSRSRLGRDRGKSELLMGARWVTPSRGNARESATENTPPGGRRRVRVKRWGKSPPPGRRRPGHGKPRAEQGQIGGSTGPITGSVARRAIPG